MAQSHSAQTLLYEVKDVPGKGKGLIATRSISSGKRIISETPMLIFSSLNRGNYADVNAKVEVLLARAPKEHQEEFRTLSNCTSTEHALAGIVLSNELPLGLDRNTGAICLKICRANHSCQPNAHHAWNEALRQYTLHAYRRIAAGEEITIKYVSGSFKERRDHLKEHFGFDCTCEKCLLPATEIAASDERWRKLAEIEARIRNEGNLRHRAQECVLSVGHAMMLLSQDNEPGGQKRCSYSDAFEIHVAHGDVARARIFSHRASALGQMYQGRDSPMALALQAFSHDPKLHQCYQAFSNDWETSRDQVPTGLSAGAFEQWLWDRCQPAGRTWQHPAA
jgi:hypothetical protein